MAWKFQQKFSEIQREKLWVHCCAGSVHVHRSACASHAPDLVLLIHGSKQPLPWSRRTSNEQFKFPKSRETRTWETSIGHCRMLAGVYRTSRYEIWKITVRYWKFTHKRQIAKIENRIYWEWPLKFLTGSASLEAQWRKNNGQASLKYVLEFHLLPKLTNHWTNVCVNAKAPKSVRFKDNNDQPEIAGFLGVNDTQTQLAGVFFAWTRNGLEPAF